MILLERALTVNVHALSRLGVLLSQRDGRRVRRWMWVSRLPFLRNYGEVRAQRIILRATEASS